MPVLLLRLAAPLQSWGTASSFAHRETAPEPTKSAVIGLLAAALGLPRTAGPLGSADSAGADPDQARTLRNLQALRFGVRVDQPGHLLRDYHTVGPASRRDGRLPTASGSGRKTGEGIITERFYLSDAAFLAAVHGNDIALLHRLDNALRAPRWPLFLGRRSCPATPPISLGIHDSDLDQALRTHPLIGGTPSGQQRLRVVTDTNDSAGELRKDHPVAYGAGGQLHAHRRVHVTYVPSPATEK